MKGFFKKGDMNYTLIGIIIAAFLLLVILRIWFPIIDVILKAPAKLIAKLMGGLSG